MLQNIRRGYRGGQLDLNLSKNVWCSPLLHKGGMGELDFVLKDWIIDWLKNADEK